MAISNFRFGVPQTGSIADRDWFRRSALGVSNATAGIGAAYSPTTGAAPGRLPFGSCTIAFHTFATRDRRATGINGCCHGLKSINGPRPARRCDVEALTASALLLAPPVAKDELPIT
jgi:hypothetical protein